VTPTASARIAGPLAAAASCGAALGVPLVFVGLLEAPFVVPKLALLELCAVAGFLAFALRAQRGRGRLLERPVAVGAALVLVTTALSWAVAAASPHAEAAFARWAAFFGMACGAAVVAGDARGRRALLETVTIAAAAVSAIGLWQHLDLTHLPIPVLSAPGSTFGNRNLAAEAVAMSLPFGLALLAAARREGGPPLVQGALVAGLLLQLAYLGATRARGAWLGVLAGVVAFLLILRPRLPRRAPLAAAAVAAVGIIAALVPGATNPRYGPDEKRFGSAAAVARASFDPESIAVRSRLGLWRRTLKIWAAHPLWGVGPGNWPVFFPRFAEPGATADQVLSPTLAPRQAHDDLLERAAETGAVGLAALLALAAGAVVATRRRLRTGETPEREATAAAAAALVALAGAGITGFPLEMPATLMLGGLSLGLVGARRPDRVTPMAGASASLIAPAALVVAVLLIPWVLLRADRQIRGSYWLGQAERALRRGSPADAAHQALPHLERARAATPHGFKIDLRLALVSLRVERLADAAAAARRALAVEPWSPNAWTVLAVTQLQQGEPVAAGKSAGRALELLRDYPLALSVAARAADAMGATSEAATARARLRTLSDPAVAGPDTAQAARDLLRD
jgi:O-antigen ligase